VGEWASGRMGERAIGRKGDEEREGRRDGGTERGRDRASRRVGEEAREGRRDEGTERQGEGEMSGEW